MTRRENVKPTCTNAGVNYVYMLSFIMHCLKLYMNMYKEGDETRPHTWCDVGLVSSVIWEPNNTLAFTCFSPRRSTILPHSCFLRHICAHRRFSLSLFALLSQAVMLCFCCSSRKIKGCKHAYLSISNVNSFLFYFFPLSPPFFVPFPFAYNMAACTHNGFYVTI